MEFSTCVLSRFFYVCGPFLNVKLLYFCGFYLRDRRLWGRTLFCKIFLIFFLPQKTKKKGGKAELFHLLIGFACTVLGQQVEMIKASLKTFSLWLNWVSFPPQKNNHPTIPSWILWERREWDKTSFFSPWKKQVWFKERIKRFQTSLVPKSPPASQEKCAGTGKRGLGGILGWNSQGSVQGQRNPGLGKNQGVKWDPNHSEIPQFSDFLLVLSHFWTSLEQVLLNPSLKLRWNHGIKTGMK